MENNLIPLKRLYILFTLLLANQVPLIGMHKSNNTYRKAQAISLEDFCKQFLKDLQDELPCLHAKFDHKEKGLTPFSNEYISLDYEHVLGIEISMRNGVPFKIGGFHHDPEYAFRKNGALKFKDTIKARGAFYKSDIFYDGRLLASKSFFPASWSRNKVVAKIFEAYKNFEKSGEEPTPLANGRYRIREKIRGGTIIEMYIKNGIILTAYPLIG